MQSNAHLTRMHIIYFCKRRMGFHSYYFNCSLCFYHAPLLCERGCSPPALLHSSNLLQQCQLLVHAVASRTLAHELLRLKNLWEHASVFSFTIYREQLHAIRHTSSRTQLSVHVCSDSSCRELAVQQQLIICIMYETSASTTKSCWEIHDVLQRFRTARIHSLLTRDVTQMLITRFRNSLVSKQTTIEFKVTQPFTPRWRFLVLLSCNMARQSNIPSSFPIKLLAQLMMSALSLASMQLV
jgi:hypothetical protein